MLICLAHNAVYQKDVRERQRFRARWELRQRKGGDRKFQYGKDVQCSSDILAAIIMMEQLVREMVQLEDQWKEEHQATLKSFSQGDDMAWIHECEEMIKYHRILGDWVERILYHLEVRLPRGTLKTLLGTFGRSLSKTAWRGVDVVVEIVDAVQSVI